MVSGERHKLAERGPVRLVASLYILIAFNICPGLLLLCLIKSVPHLCKKVTDQSERSRVRTHISTKTYHFMTGLNKRLALVMTPPRGH